MCTQSLESNDDNMYHNHTLFDVPLRYRRREYHLALSLSVLEMDTLDTRCHFLGRLLCVCLHRLIST